MIAVLFMGAAAGMRAMTPLAVIAQAAQRGELSRESGASALLARPVVSLAVLALAAGEYAGDKMKGAPDRIVAAGLAARIATGAIAGVALAPAPQRRVAALVGAASAVAGAYLSFGLRRRAIRRFGQSATGAVEDGLALGTAALAIRAG